MKVVDDQRGLVSMVIVTVLMIVITIMTLSFSNVVRNEQRQTLDRQLNTQAYYAAESGVNYGAKIVREQLEAGTPIAELQKTDCPSNTIYQDNLVLNQGLQVSCLLVNTSPGSLVYTLDPAAQSKIFPIKPTSSIDRFEIEWSPAPGNNVTSCPSNASTAASLPAAGSWSCPFGVIRIDIARTSNVSRQALAQNTFSNLFMPLNTASASTVFFDNGTNAFSGSAAQGSRYPAQCDASRCRATVRLSGSTSEEFYARVQTIYRPTNLTFRALQGTTEVPLRDAQIVVDATGKSQDVLRRIQTRIPLVGQSVHADYGLQSRDNICKQFTAYDPTQDNRNDGRTFPNTTPGCD